VPYKLKRKRHRKAKNRLRNTACQAKKKGVFVSNCNWR